MNQATKQVEAPPARQSRMSVKNAVKGKLEVPDRILLYGVEGIGKSSWAAASPAPMFIEPEREGTARIDTNRFPQPECWQDILDAVESLTVDKHDYQTCVIDTLDSAEAMLWRHICERDKKASIEDYGYGKGYMAAIDEWRVLLAALERLRRERRMGIILNAHSWIKTFKNPEGEDFDRYELKLHAKAGGLLKEWCDAVLFANYETFAVKEEDKKGARAKGVSSGARIIHTQRTAAWDAKNRYSLPATIPLHYEDFAAAVKAHRPADPETLRAAIVEQAAKLGDDVTSKKVETFLASDKARDASELAKINNWLTAKLSAKGA